MPNSPAVLFVFTALAVAIGTSKLLDKEVVDAKMTMEFPVKDWPDPPDWRNKTLTARYLAHTADWGVVSMMSAQFKDTPFGIVQSFADGPVSKGSGVPYFYISDISTVYRNIMTNNRCSLTVTEAEGHYCWKHDMDPESPPCAQLTLSGNIIKVQKDEESVAANALFSRHPKMKTWPTGHEFHFYKMKLTSVWLIDYFGGAAIIPVDEYLKMNY